MTTRFNADRPAITLDIQNRSGAFSKLRIMDAYSRQTVTRTLEPGRSLTWHWPLEASFGWYDLTIEVESDSSFQQRLAGHVESGFDSVTDPALGA